MLNKAIVRLENVTKTYGSVTSLKQVTLEIGSNEIVGLIGDNGAGKSTLIKIITGAIPPSGGRLFIRGQEMAPGHYSVRKAREARIETVYQDRALGEKQALWRNFFVGRAITNRFGFINVKAEKKIAEEIMRSTIGFRSKGLDVNTPVSRLSGGERQGVAIGRAMYFESDLIILDEPTVALAIGEVRKVLDFIRAIKHAGKSCIYIEHNIRHVAEVADRVIVLDRGEIALNERTGDMNPEALTDFLLSLHGAAEQRTPR